MMICLSPERGFFCDDLKILGSLSYPLVALFIPKLIRIHENTMREMSRSGVQVGKHQPTRLSSNMSFVTTTTQQHRVKPSKEMTMSMGVREDVPPKPAISIDLYT